MTVAAECFEYIHGFRFTNSITFDCCACLIKSRIFFDFDSIDVAFYSKFKVLRSSVFFVIRVIPDALMEFASANSSISTN